jgi:hypothetical protein
MKKRNILIGTVVLFALGFLHACDLIEECGTCQLVTEQADGTKTTGTPLPFCGDDLKDKETQSPVTVGGVTTYWECY